MADPLFTCHVCGGELEPSTNGSDSFTCRPCRRVYTHAYLVTEWYSQPKVADLGWHVISGEDLLAMLRRVEGGESPDLVYAEEYANAEHEHVNG